MNFARIAAPQFNLQSTLECGQVFHWRRTPAGYYGMIGNTPFWAIQDGDELLVPPGGETLARHYFALDHPLAEICATFPDDPAMNAARDFAAGMRIVRQPPWEVKSCLAFQSSVKKKPISYCETEATGLPVVAYESDRTRWIVTDEAFFADRADPASLPAKLATASQSKSAVQAIMCQRAQSFAWSAIAAQYENFFKELCAT